MYLGSAPSKRNHAQRDRRWGNCVRHKKAHPSREVLREGWACAAYCLSLSVTTADHRCPPPCPPPLRPPPPPWKPPPPRTAPPRTATCEAPPWKPPTAPRPAKPRPSKPRPRPSNPRPNPRPPNPPWNHGPAPMKMPPEK